MADSAYLKDQFGLDGQTAVVIGGTGTLCGRMAETLAKAGAETVIVGRNAEKARERLERIRGEGGTAWFQEADATERASVENLKRAVAEQSGKIDILINGAGANSATPFLDIEDKEFDRLVDANLRSVFLACQIVGRHMVDRGAGSIINIGSMGGVNPISKVFTYCATKAAVHNLSGNLAREWGASGVRVNTLVPGFFPAEQNRKILTDERIADIMRHTPAKRFGDPEDLAGATLLLAGPAGRFMTGAEILVDGGFNAMSI